MEVLKIYKQGKNGRVETVVTREMYENTYKKEKWLIEGNLPVINLTPENDCVIKEKEKVKRHKPKTFNDNIIKE